MSDQLLSVLTADEIRKIIREELAAILKTQPEENDEVGAGAEFAAKIIDRKPSTVYRLVQHRKIPHSKRSGGLYFSRKELEQWKLEGRRMTRTEIAAKATSS